MSNILISICARGGSKGIPGKNIKLIGGKPLIAYTIETAIKLQDKIGNCDIGLSTDSITILEEARKYGLETDYIRPIEMATDTAGKLDAIKDLLLYHETIKSKKYDYSIDMDVTSPLRTVDDVLKGLEILEQDLSAMNLFSVNKAHRNPYFNMVEEDGNGYYKLIKEGTFLTRQSAPKVYDLNASFYIFRRAFFDNNCKTINGRTLIYEMPHICFDLDEPIDFEFMQYLLENNKLGFAL
jgi:CMP-N,N'-diacetyllegionaminic acid synthase